jgi:hypothetical protein
VTGRLLEQVDKERLIDLDDREVHLEWLIWHGSDVVRAGNKQCVHIATGHPVQLLAHLGGGILHAECGVTPNAPQQPRFYEVNGFQVVVRDDVLDIPDVRMVRV